MTSSRTVTTKDGLVFTVHTRDVIKLTAEQFNHLATTVLKRKAAYIVKDGVDIAALTTGQVQAVLNEIRNVIGESIDPLADSLISISRHIAHDHARNTAQLTRRGWYRDSILELYKDIVNVIKESTHVRKAILKFNPFNLRSYPTFTFTVAGVKVNGEQGEVAIAFSEDDANKIIIAVTII